MISLNYLKIPINASVKTTYESNNPSLFDDGDNLIIEVLPNSYRISNSGTDYDFFEGIKNTAVLVKETLYRFSVVTKNTSNDLGLILASLEKTVKATPGQITPITVNDYLNFSDEYAGQNYEPRQCTLKFQAVSGSMVLTRGQQARPGGYQIEFTQLS